MRKKSFFFAIEVVFFIWIIIPLLLIFLNINLNMPILDHMALKIIGILLCLFAIFISLKSFSLFDKFGFGTPIPIEPPKEIVKKGLYKYIRNPMYVVYILSFLGIFFVFGHLLLFFYFLISIPLFHTYVVKFEEPSLNKRFGKAYKKYCQEVPRWGFKT